LARFFAGLILGLQNAKKALKTPIKGLARPISRCDKWAVWNASICRQCLL